MTGEQRIEAPRERVWAALNDPAVLKDCIPGCQSLERIAPDRLKAVAAIKVGPIGARFRGEVSLLDQDPPNGYRIEGEGQGGVAGFARGGATVRLAEDGADATILTYRVDVQIGGKLAQVGGALIDATAKQMAGAFFRKFGQRVNAPAAADDAIAAAPSAAPHPGAASAPPVPATTMPATAVRSVGGGAGPVGWAAAVLVALVVGYLAGRGGHAGGVEAWVGLAVGLTVVIAAAAGFLIGRGAGGPVIVIDRSLFEHATPERAS